MDRLTEYWGVSEPTGPILIGSRGKACDKVCFSKGSCDGCPIDIAIRKLAAYEDFEEAGLLVQLPCKAGDTVYQLLGRKHARGECVWPRFVSYASVGSDGDYALHHQGQTPCTKAQLGISWFLTEEEAEAALRKKEIGTTPAAE